MPTRCLLVLLEAPMSSFGGDVIDNRGVVNDFPGRSLLTGLVGNALGYDRADADKLDRLQSRLVHVAARLRDGRRVRDYQTARLFEKDVGWTTRGRPEGRATSPSFSWDERYERERGVRMKSLTHQRYRDFDVDASTLVALSLSEGETDDGNLPDVDDVARALDRPERPLFIGRKPNLPAGRMCRGVVVASSPAAALAMDALRSRSGPLPVEGHVGSFGIDLSDDGVAVPSVVSLDEGHEAYRLQRHRIGDERRHRAGVHAGDRVVLRGWLRPAAEAEPEQIAAVAGDSSPGSVA